MLVHTVTKMFSGKQTLTFFYAYYMLTRMLFYIAGRVENKTISKAMAQYQREDRKFVCPYWIKECSMAHNLAEHLMIHTGVRRYTCPVCNKGFIKKWNMKVHQMNAGHYAM